MTGKKVIIDTGPLVAFLNKSDTYHEWTIQQFDLLSPPFFTCEAVISETCFLLRKKPIGQQNLFKLIERGLIRISFDLQSELNHISKLMKQYENIPMSFADSCLVRMSEQIEQSIICTLDSDFKIYRQKRKKLIQLIIPENI